MFSRPGWVHNQLLNGCSCDTSGTGARTSNTGNGLLFNPDPLVTVGVSFSQQEILKLAAALGVAVLVGTALGNRFF